MGSPAGGLVAGGMLNVSIDGNWHRMCGFSVSA